MRSAGSMPLQAMPLSLNEQQMSLIDHMGGKNKYSGASLMDIIIDGKPLKAREGMTVLQAALQAGIYIPRICYLEDLPPYGGCRLCMVEIKDLRGYPTACTTPVSPAMEVITRSPELQRLRREILELILSEHPYTCLVCRDNKACTEYMHSTRKTGVATGCNFCSSNGECELQELVEYLDLKEIRFPVIYRGLEPVHNNPFYILDYNLCILCGRCVRICNEERNSNVLAFVRRGNTTLVGTAFNETQKEAGCEFCGACVDVCPTGSLTEKIGKWSGTPDKSVQSTCTFCSVGCSMNSNIKGDHLVNIGPAPGTRSRPLQLCLRGKFVVPELIYHPERILEPLVRRNGSWVQVPWDEAIAFTAQNMQQFKDGKFGIIGSAQETMETNYILQQFARQVMRTKHVDLLYSYPEREIMRMIHGSISSGSRPDIGKISKASALLIIGCQASVSHPIIENRIRKAYRNGCQVMAANSTYNLTTDFTSLYEIYEQGQANGFLRSLFVHLAGSLGKRMQGFKKSRTDSKHIASDQYVTSQIREIVTVLNRSGNGVIIVGDEILRSPDSLNNLALLLGIHRLLKQSWQIMFLLDEGDRYGATLAGMHPDYLPGFVPVNDKESKPGMTSAEMILDSRRDGISSLCVVGDIPAHEGLADLKFFMQCNLFLTEASSFSHVFFPITSIAEQGGHILNLEGKLKTVRPSVTPVKSVKSVIRILSEIAHEMNERDFSYRRPPQVMKELKHLIKGIGHEEDREYLDPWLGIEKEKEEMTEGTRVLIPEGICFYYLGNRLSGLIPDLKWVLDQESG